MASSMKNRGKHSGREVRNQAQRQREEENTGIEPRICVCSRAARFQDQKYSGSDQQQRQHHCYEGRKKGPEDHSAIVSVLNHNGDVGPQIFRFFLFSVIERQLHKPAIALLPDQNAPFLQVRERLYGLVRLR